MPGIPERPRHQAPTPRIRSPSPRGWASATRSTGRSPIPCSATLTRTSPTTRTSLRRSGPDGWKTRERAQRLGDLLKTATAAAPEETASVPVGQVLMRAVVRTSSDCRPGCSRGWTRSRHVMRCRNPAEQQRILSASERSDLGDELDDAARGTTIRIQIRVIDRYAPAGAAAALHSRHPDLGELLPGQPAG